MRGWENFFTGYKFSGPGLYLRPLAKMAPPIRVNLPAPDGRGSGLVDVLDRVLDKGLVVAGDIKVSLAEVELLTIRIRLMICSIDKAEEIGLEKDDLEDFRPLAVCVNDDSGSALVVYHARLSPHAEPEPDEKKVAELHWAMSPAELGAQVSGDTVACWEALKRWRAEALEGTRA